MESYIVRIYRRMRNPKDAVGVVETSGRIIREKSFRNAQELWSILVSQSSINADSDDKGKKFSDKKRSKKN